MLPTERPSRPDLEVVDDDHLLGMIIASQTRIERSWEAMKHEHETFARTSTALHRDVKELREEVRELLETERKTSRKVTTATRAAPLVLALVELIRAALAAYGL